MTIAEKVANTRIEERPLIDYNGVISHMADAQYAEYLEGLEYMPTPSPSQEERLAALESAMLDLMMGGPGNV